MIWWDASLDSALHIVTYTKHSASSNGGKWVTTICQSFHRSSELDFFHWHESSAGKCWKKHATALCFVQIQLRKLSAIVFMENSVTSRYKIWWFELLLRLTKTCAEYKGFDKIYQNWINASSALFVDQNSCEKAELNMLNKYRTSSWGSDGQPAALPLPNGNEPPLASPGAAMPPTPLHFRFHCYTSKHLRSICHTQNQIIFALRITVHHCAICLCQGSLAGVLRTSPRSLH